ncbi:DMT family transporter [Microbacterium sp. cf332]|uniref:DMT family transporter n=1 Tax=Microbacterium sp. cf332 TaxID=1761804 RepID=UPI00088A2B35|nr:DMT family transporter [Microbacterium sp. cf332]SDQ87580.1 transporter family-2 protein [Microbacterium sp. cf332]
MNAQARTSTLPLGLAVAGAVLVGILTAVQARINGALGAAVGDGFVAAFISFATGLVLILAITVLTRGGRNGVRLLVAGAGRGIPVWMLLGGLAGAVTVATQGLTVATIGVALFTVGVVAGQTAGGLILDRVGYGPAGVVAVTVPRLVGGLLAIAGVILCALGPRGEPVPWWMLLLPVVAGAGIAWQQGTNGRLRHEIGSPITATAVNFAGGTIALGIAAAVSVTASGVPDALPSAAWVYLGGPTGVVYIVLSAALVKRTGVLLLGLGSVVGLLSASIVLDAVAPPPSGPSLLAASTAAAVAFAGVVIAVVPWRRRAR